MPTPELASPPPDATDRPPHLSLGAAFPHILERAAAGDRAAFAELWRSAHPGLLRYLFVVCGGTAAEDVASETWLKVIRHLDSFTGDERAFRGWLVAVARNTAIDQGRRVTRRKERLDGLAPDGVHLVAPDTADLALEAMSTRAALDLLATLRPAVAEMIALRVIVGLDATEVAALVGKSPGAVRVAVHRGLRTLAGSLREAPEPAGAGLL